MNIQSSRVSFHFPENENSYHTYGGFWFDLRKKYEENNVIGKWKEVLKK
jgi:hypothetical protein